MSLILYQEDWDKNPSAIVDHKTKNTEFVRLAALYREMGIKNHNFILALHNPELRDINPFDPNLGREEIQLVADECRDNFWYFIREIARDPAGNELSPILFHPNRGIISAYWLYFNHLTFFLIMIRQTGKSFGIDWLYTYLLNIGSYKYEIAQLTKDDKLRSREVERLKAMELTLPYYLKMRDKFDPANTEFFRIGLMENYIRFYLMQKSDKAADLVGRGMTAGTAGADEFAYLINNHITIPVMLSATQTAREVAIRMGNPYGTPFMTTSGKRDTAEGKYAYNLVHNAAVFSDQFYDTKNQEELYKVVASGNKKKGYLHVNCSWNHRQLGKTDEWLMKRLVETMQEDLVAIEADYFNKWPSGGRSSPFRQSDAEAIRNSKKDEFFTKIEGQDCYAFRWYYPENEIEARLAAEPHFLCIDPSDAVGQDSIGITMLNATNGHVVAATAIGLAFISSFAEWLGQYLIDHPRVTLIVERRSTGSSILDHVILFLASRGVNPFTRIYNRIVHEAEEFPQRFEEIKNMSPGNLDLLMKYKKSFGFSTSASGLGSRGELYSKTLNNAVRYGMNDVNDEPLILQILGLVVKNNRIDHEDGEHDDMVIAWLLGFWLALQGKNLQFYGINAMEIMSKNYRILEETKEQSSYEAYQQRYARREVERLKAEIEQENDPYILRRLELDLSRFAARLNEENRRIVAVDDFIEKMRNKNESQYGNRTSSSFLSESLERFRQYQDTDIYIG